MKKHILCVTTTLPSPGFGSSVIIYRHLMGLKDWKVSILTPSMPTHKHHEIPDSWKIVTAPETPRLWLRLIRNLPFSLDTKLKFVCPNYGSLLADGPSAILNQLGKNSILAYHVSKSWNVPLTVLIHDPWTVWMNKNSPQIDLLFMNDKTVTNILNHATSIFPVSEELQRLYPVENTNKVSLLPPMPEQNKRGFVDWRDDFIKRPRLAFAGSFHNDQLNQFRRFAEALADKGGELIIVSKSTAMLKAKLSGIANIVLKDAFSSNSQLLDFLHENASGVLVPTDINSASHRLVHSFPSKFVEFSQLGLPIILTCAPGTSLSNWANAHEWMASANDLDNEKISSMIARLTDKSSWIKMAEQTRMVALSEFNPVQIQKQFEERLEGSKKDTLES